MPPDSTVAIAREAHPYQCTRMCLEMLRLDGFRGLSSVFVKFNLAPYFQFRWAGVDPSHRAGVGTHPEVVRAVIHHLRDIGVPRIIVGEGPAGNDSQEAFQACGYAQMCKEEDVPLVDLDSDEVVEMDIPGAQSLHRVGLARTVTEAEALVNVCWMRTHTYTVISLCLKNLMGIVRLQKDIIHEPFPQRITDLAMVVKPKLSLIDATTAFDEAGDQVLVPMNLTLAGSDIVAVDAVGTGVMGFDPLSIDYIRVAQERHLGIADLGRISVVGLRIEEVRRPFAFPRK